MSPMFRADFRWLAATLLLTGALACDAEKPTPTPVEKADNKADADNGNKADAKVEPKPQGAQATGKQLATVDASVPLALPQLLQKPPAEVEAMLGPHRGKALRSSSCTRFVPERVRFKCDRIWQVYDDKTNTYAGVHVLWENDLSTEVAYDLKPRDEPFSPEAALLAVGLKLPGTPKVATPAEGVTLWQWFNQSARLLIHGQQYRVNVSARDNSWEGAQVTVTLNHPLTDEQKSLLVQDLKDGDPTPVEATPTPPVEPKTPPPPT